jgi:hypothetical protein
MQRQPDQSRFFPFSDEPTPEVESLAALIETTISTLENPACREKASILSDFIKKFKTHENEGVQDGYSCALIFPALKRLSAQRQISVYLSHYGTLVKTGGNGREYVMRFINDILPIREDYRQTEGVKQGKSDSKYDPVLSALKNVNLFMKNHVNCSELEQLFSFFWEYCRETCKLAKHETYLPHFQCGLLLCADDYPPSPYDYIKCGSFYAYHGRDAEAIACYRIAIATRAITPFSDDVVRAFSCVDACQKPDLNQMEGLLRDKTLSKLIENCIRYLCLNPDDENFYEVFTLSLLRKNKSAVASALLLLPTAKLYPLLNEIFSLSVSPNPLKMSLWRQRGLHPCEFNTGSLSPLYRQLMIMRSVNGTDEDLLTHEQFAVRARVCDSIDEPSKYDHRKAAAMKRYDDSMSEYMGKLNSYYSSAGTIDEIFKQKVALVRNFTLDALSEKIYNIALCEYMHCTKFNSEGDYFLSCLIYKLHQCHELRPITDIFTSNGKFLPGKKRLRVSEPYYYVASMSPEKVLTVIESLDDFMQMDILNSCLDGGQGLWKDLLVPTQRDRISARVEVLKARRNTDYVTTNKVQTRSKVKLLATMIRWFDLEFSVRCYNLDIYKRISFAEYIWSHSPDEVLAALAMLPRSHQLNIYENVINRNGWMQIIRNLTSNSGIPPIMANRKEILELTNCKNDDEFTVEDWSHFVTKTRVGEFDARKILYACKRIMELAPESDHSILNYYFFASMLDRALAHIDFTRSKIYNQYLGEIVGTLKEYIEQHPDCGVPHLVLAMILFSQALTGEVMYHYCKSRLAGSDLPQKLVMDRKLPLKLNSLKIDQFVGIHTILKMQPEDLFKLLTNGATASMQKYVLSQALNDNDIYGFMPTLRDKVESRLAELDQRENELMDFVVIEESQHDDEAPRSPSRARLFTHAPQVPAELQAQHEADKARVDSIFEL